MFVSRHCAYLSPLICRSGDTVGMIPGPLTTWDVTRAAMSPISGAVSRGQSGLASEAGGSISSVGTAPVRRHRLSSRSYSSRHRVHPSSLIMNFMRLRCLCL